MLDGKGRGVVVQCKSRSSRDVSVKEVREFLNAQGGAQYTSAVVKALRSEPAEWLEQLQTKQREGTLAEFVQGCKPASGTDANSELAEGLRENSTLKELKQQQCGELKLRIVDGVVLQHPQ